MIPYDQILFIGLPLLVIVLLASINAYRDGGEDGLSPSPTVRFLLWFAIAAMIVSFVGFAGNLIALFAFGWIPGTASEGGFVDGRYYFNWHDETYTEVSATTWRVAYVLEQATSRAMFVGIAAFFGSIAALFAIVRVFGKGVATEKKPRTDAAKGDI